MTAPFRRLAVLAGAVAAALLALLLLQLITLRSSHDRITAQDRKIAELLEESRPVLRDARPLVDQASEALRPLRETGRDVSAAAESVPRLVADLAEAIEQAGPLLRAVEAEELANLVDGLTLLVDASIDGGRLRLALDRASAALAELADRDLLAGAETGLRDLRRVRSLQARTLRVQLRTLAIQQRSLRVQEDSLAVQRESLVHIRNLDRRLGGGVPAP